MKNRKILFHSLLLIMLACFWSCEKGLDNISYHSTIYFPQSGLSEVNLLWGESNYALAVYRAGINQDNKSYEVTINYDQAGGEAFINDSTNYELVVDGQPVLFKDFPQNMRFKLLPADFYNLPGDQVTIGGDNERGFYNLQFYNVNEAINGAKYILPLRIENVTPEAEVLVEKSAVILYLSDYRNVYGGTYRALGKVSSPDDANQLKIDTYYDAKSIGQNSVRVPGPVNGMQVKLTVNGGQVDVSAAKGSESYNIKGVEGKNTYTGEFSEKYQRNKGDFTLVYTYEIEKEVKQDDGSTIIETWVYTVEETLKFWL